MSRRVLMGNEAIGRAIVECGCAVATAYPGTPASEIQEAVMAFARETGSPIHAEWSVNEKVAYEVALAASYTGKRAAVSMKQVGLNAAADPFMRSAYLGVKGGFLVVSADDPGPHSSQTEQDSRFFAMFAKVPVLDPSSPREAKAMVRLAFALSEEYEIPVVLRPTTRICHARQAVTLEAPDDAARAARFDKDPQRWAATPRAVLTLHRGLTEKLLRLAADARLAPIRTPGDGTFRRTCLVGSGVAFAHAQDVLDELGLVGKLDLYQVTAPFPLAAGFGRCLTADYDRVLVIEETYPVIELQLQDRSVEGRQSRLVPSEGELTPELLRGILATFLGLPPAATPARPPQPGPARRSARAAATARHSLPSARRSREGYSPATSAATRWGESGRSGHLPLHGGRHQPGGRLLSRLRPGRGRLSHHRGHHRRLHVFPLRHPGPGERRGAAGALHPRHPGQRHHGHDRSPAHSGPGCRRGTGAPVPLRDVVRGAGRVSCARWIPTTWPPSPRP